MNLIKTLLLLVIFTAGGWGQTRAQLQQALAECEADLQASLQKIEALSQALRSTDTLIKQRETILDSLLTNLQQQIETQATIRARLEMNADTLQIMINAYQQKLDEVANLYRKELQRSTRPWILTRQGLQGFTTGVLIGGALGLIYGLLN